MSKPKTPWLAGLQEHRIALGIAATASLLLVGLLLMQPGSKSTSESSRGQETVSTTIKPHTEPAVPRYSVPEKTPQHPDRKGQAGNASRPTIRVITPSTPSQPVATRKPASQIKTKPPVQAKQAKKAKTKRASLGNTATMPKQTAQVFFVQVGAYRERSSAQKQAATLLQKGWNSMVTVNTKGFYVVRVGPASSRSAANKLRLQLADKAKLKGFIVEG